ncbi:putative membrane-bound metal-dependent hydrolase [Halorhabdus utahensis DSM 12940]|uniref:Putative membrane-bound metal-dependent hydrolase n=1 Tax=Halorhabdus utahensis (strain DSM 12940 / JCM 11049 / AX-2) TaxID=519442 RepID=C7NM59_HALUD|nr:metal-dependent hydrolase [Halorhabdus utahensis]ACV11267.1 putative membrane-bound metal-dependent hydrolase [Halorhabdus utahensis DSM 12940]
MWPWGHAAVGYLCYVGIATITGDRRYGLPVLAVLLGTQFPDLIDKPLAWTVPLLPSGRSLAHSLVTTGPVLLGALLIAYRARPRRSYLVATLGFALGHVTHVLGDGLHAFLDGMYSDLSYLAWPVLAPPAYETEQSFIAHFQQFEPTGTVLFEFALVGLAIAVWVILRVRSGGRSLWFRRLRKMT